jgi:pyruvyl transferase EpsO
MSDRDLIASLDRQIERTLRLLLPPGSRCALLDFPNHSNVGDSAIWLGEIACLRRLNVAIEYHAETNAYSRERLRSRLPAGTILLHGGGSLGDLWPPRQEFRERVIREFPDYRIIQLPQSIHFSSPNALARARAIFNRHTDLTLLLRDRVSLRIARNEFKAESQLCPDMALALGAVNAPAQPSVDIVWLRRTDIESAGRTVSLLPSGVEPTDWLGDPVTPILRAYNLLLRHAARHPRLLRSLFRAAARLHDATARQRLARGVLTLSRGRVVITDRLHGHILSLLLGLPHVVLENSYGKLGSFYATWTQDSTLAHWAESEEEALEMAKRIAANRA